MSEQQKRELSFTAINKNDQIKKLRTFGDRLSDAVTKIAGSSVFLALNITWFALWILVNIGAFGNHLIFDKYPFGFLTMVVSLEAIILSIFVLISQNRQSKHSEIHAEMDYITDLQSAAQINIIISVLERIASKNDIDITDLLDDLTDRQKKIIHEHPITKRDLEG